MSTTVTKRRNFTAQEDELLIHQALAQLPFTAKRRMLLDSCKRLPMQSSAANSSRVRTSKASTHSTVLISYLRSVEHSTLSQPRYQVS
ncbi:TPA: hypothetical protein N0F65_008714 [Lagenidium giganteum]|uniref:Uncharacterized protein n=1 Tax=Lagenidium giganteum TaxID=4803 RepID=A0AAV2YPX3_9STRA|nr:TPA: hypothetical protein N0F65_008714 [Lagenidium giganteum]